MIVFLLEKFPCLIIEKQGEKESVDDFHLRCKDKAMKCQSVDNNAMDERMIEVIIAGIKYPRYNRLC